MDKLGEEALEKGLDTIHQPAPKGRNLYWTTLVGDLIGNAVYYSLTGSEGKYAWPRGAMLGIAAGLGALELPAKMGLNPEYSNKNRERQLMTLGLYLAGGLIAAAVVKAMNSKS